MTHALTRTPVYIAGVAETALGKVPDQSEMSMCALATREALDEAGLRLRDVDHAKQLANEAVYGFQATEVALDRARIGALLKDAQGRQMLLRRHGAMWVGRLLDRQVEARLDREFLTIGTGEKTFGTVTLQLGEAAPVWAAGLRRIPNA